MTDVSQVYRQRLAVEFITEKNVHIKGLHHDFLLDLCESLKMTRRYGPMVLAGERGISAWMVWTESGVQLHAWFNEKLIAVDIFSCKPYVFQDVVDAVRRHYGAVNPWIPAN